MQFRIYIVAGCLLIAAGRGVSAGDSSANNQRMCKQHLRVQGGRSSGLANQYRRQMWAVDKVLDWIAKNGRVPMYSDFGPGDGKVGFLAHQFLGNGMYAQGKRRNRIFSSPEEAWLAVKRRAKKRHISFLLLAITLQPATEKIRHEWQAEAVDLVLDWIAKNHRVPVFQNFGDGEGRVGVEQERFVSGIFSSPEEAWLAVKRRAKERGVLFRLLNVEFHSATEMIRCEWQTEAVDLVLDWVARNERVPTRLDFGASEGKVGFDQQQFVGTGGYAEGEDVHENRIFSSAEEAWLAVKRRATERGILLRLIDIRFRPPTEAVRQERQAEAVDLVLDWIAKNGRIPVFPDFGAGDRKVGVDQQQFVGTGCYAEGSDSYNSRIFSSYGEAWRVVLEKLRSDERIVPEKRAELVREVEERITIIGGGG